MPAHKDGTKTFDELTNKEKASSISAQIVHLEDAIDNRIRSIEDPKKQKEVADTSIAQIERLLDRLRAKYP
jgi:hypothetical protein